MPPGEAEVSIEEILQRRFNIQVGDEMRFDVLGRIVSARVTSFREVDFRDFRAGGFMIVFRPGTFDNAPHTFIASVRAPRDQKTRALMQRAVVNVHAFADLLEAHVKRRRDLEIVISDERAQLMETGGGLKQARPLLGDDPIIICNIDSVWEEPMGSAITRLAKGYDPSRMSARTDAARAARSA